MKIHVKKGKLWDYDTEAIALFHFEDDKKLKGAAKAINEHTALSIGEIINSGDFAGKLLQTSFLYGKGLIPAKRIFLVGLGKRKDFDLEKFRNASAKTAQEIRDLNLKKFATSLDIDVKGFSLNNLTEALVEGIILGLYQFNHFKTVERDKIKEVQEAVIVEDQEDNLKIIKPAVKSAEIISCAVSFVRDLVSTPANELTPSDLANKARELENKKHVKVNILGSAQIKKMGMHSFLGVAKGSDEPPKFIILEYHGSPKKQPYIALVGKGITFDSGGISIKPSEKMDEMKTDMAGGAAVLGVIRAAADLNLPVNIVGLIPATENLPSGKAYKPGDILKSMSGQTIEVLNTDAEGRLILADALSYATRYKPAAIIDLATLTGACIIALGDTVIGMMGTDENLKKRLQAAGCSTGEMVWELPLWEEYHELIKSDIADFKNSGGRAGGAITAAAFLSKFVGKYPWVHLDIAGPALYKKDKPYIPKGGSGVGVRLLLHLLRNWPVNE
jgi:leucyl aminopeptidase